MDHRGASGAHAGRLNPLHLDGGWNSRVIARDRPATTRDGPAMTILRLGTRDAEMANASSCRKGVCAAFDAGGAADDGCWNNDP